MRYLKLFENLEQEYVKPKYNEGDYVLIDVSKISIDLNTSFDTMAKVFGKNWIHNDQPVYIHNYENTNSKYPYEVLTYKYDFDTPMKYQPNNYTSVSEDEIIRKLTPEEIEEFEAKKASVKYNL